MKKNPVALIALLGLLFFLPACGEKPASATTSAEQASKGPRIELSLERVPANGITVMHGIGFTPLSTVESHLKRPDSTEFNPLLFYTDEKGEFRHEIESFLLLKGVHEVWVVDLTSGQKSNVAKFETTLDQIPVAK